MKAFYVYACILSMLCTCAWILSKCACIFFICACSLRICAYILCICACILCIYLSNWCICACIFCICACIFCICACISFPYRNQIRTQEEKQFWITNYVIQTKNKCSMHHEIMPAHYSNACNAHVYIIKKRKFVPVKVPFLSQNLSFLPFLALYNFLNTIFEI